MSERLARSHPTACPADLLSLPAASICGFKLFPRVRAALLGLGPDVRFVELRAFLAAVSARTGIERAARTERERELVLDRYERFLEAASESARPGRAQSPKLAWIVPDAWLNLGYLVRRGLVEKVEREGAATGYLRSDYHEWLPWMSLGIVNLLRRWRRPRVNAVRRSLFKLAVARAGTGAYPWEPAFPSAVRRLPMQTLYQYEPTDLLEGAIEAFVDLGLRSVNDLRCCHPDAVIAAKAEDKPLFALYRVLGD